jgi:type I site-specific restriction-modification system R (restriction) subunit
MATDDPTTETETETPTETPTETEATKAGADKAIEALKAENERIKKAMAENNRKSAADRARLKDIDDEAKERENAKLGESEKLRKQLKELEDQKRESDQLAARLQEDLIARRIDTEIERAARPLFTHPEVAVRMVERERIVHDPDTDKVSGIKEALDAVLKKYPDLGTAARGAGSPAAMRQKRPEGGGEKQADLRAEFAKMGGYEKM